VATPTETRDVFLASLNRCLAEPGFVAGFYDRFLRSSPQVREKFRNADMERQFRVLADSLYIVANAVQSEEGSLARSDLPRLAERHDRTHLDIAPHLYGLWTDCLIATARATDARFDAAVEAAWRETLAFGVRYMTERY
jgi:hemoglobin-like flavoprotein